APREIWTGSWLPGDRISVQKSAAEGGGEAHGGGVDAAAVARGQQVEQQAPHAGHGERRRRRVEGRAEVVEPVLHDGVEERGVAVGPPQGHGVRLEERAEEGGAGR